MNTKKNTTQACPRVKRIRPSHLLLLPIIIAAAIGLIVSVTPPHHLRIGLMQARLP